jgi:hypothetical protein
MYASLETVIEALRTERQYQLRRWGCRQPDGSMIEVPHSVADYVLYMQDYYHEARHHVSREDGIAGSLEALRKLVGLGIACLEQHDRKDKDEHYTFDDLAERIRRTGRFVPLTLNPDYSNYLLKIGFHLADAVKYAAWFNQPVALSAVRDMVQVGVECFGQYGIEPRNGAQVVTNGRDGQPA